MKNREAKNWNNFFLGLVVAVLPLLALPSGLKTVLLVICGLLIALFSLATVKRRDTATLPAEPAPADFPKPTAPTTVHEPETR